MRLLFATHSLRGYPKRKGGFPKAEDRRNLFSWARRKGFDGLEVGDWWFDFFTASDEETAQLKEEMAEYGLELAGFNCLRKCVSHPDAAERNRRDLRRSVDLAKRLQLGFVSISLALPSEVSGTPDDRLKGLEICAGGGRDASERDFVDTAGFLADLAADAAGAGVEIAIELHHGSIADTSRRILQLIEMAKQPNLSANPDVVNLYWGYETPEEPWYEALDRLAGHVKVWHVKNVQRVHVPELGHAFFTHAALDEGDIDYRWALTRLVAGGFDGYVSIEGAGPGDLLAFAARGKVYFDELMSDLSAGIGLTVQ